MLIRLTPNAPVASVYFMANNSSPIVSTKTTFCGVTVHLHADGSVSDRMRYLAGGKLPRDIMWRVWADLCIWTHEELPGLIRSVKDGTWVPFTIDFRPPMTEERFQEIRASHVQTCGFDSNGVFRRWV